MKLWLLTPIKPFAEGKSRLAGALTHSARAALSRQLFQHVMAQATAATVLSGILVVGRDPNVLQGIHNTKIEFIAEEETGLNHALRQGRWEAIQRGANAVLILPADLPHLTTAEITALYEKGQETVGMVIAPSDDNGTNALLLRPPAAINFAFGHNSFAHHCLAAQLAGVPYTIYDSPRLSFDVDLPTDLHRLVPSEQPVPSYTSAALPQPCR